MLFMSWSEMAGAAMVLVTGVAAVVSRTTEDSAEAARSSVREAQLLSDSDGGLRDGGSGEGGSDGGTVISRDAAAGAGGSGGIGGQGGGGAAGRGGFGGVGGIAGIGGNGGIAIPLD